jgi:excisionase family DNA binding protein
VNEPASPWLTKREAAERARCSTSTVERAIRAGHLRAGRAGRLVRIRVEAVDAWLGDPGPAARASRIAGMADDELELIDYVRSRVAHEAGLSPAQGARLRGSTVAELRSDARAMRDELGLEPLDDDGATSRDGRGRFRKGDIVDMNRIIRDASGRHG